MERLEYHNTKDTLQAQHEAALQEKTREDMIAYYAELSREAELRQLRAEWRAKRYQLSSQRFEFLSNERNQLVVENETSVRASKVPSPQRLTSNSFVQETPSNVTVNMSLLDEAIDTDMSQIIDSTNMSDSTPRQTLAESSSQQQVTSEQVLRKTWSASRTDQPVQNDVAQELHHFMEESESKDHFLVIDTKSVNSSTLHLSSHPTSVVQDLLYHQETTDPAIFSKLSQIEVCSPHVHPNIKEQLSVAKEILYPVAQLAAVQEEGAPRLVSSRGQEASSTAQDIIYGSGQSTERRYA